MRSGKLLTIEGVDGAGTTTQAGLLAEELRRRGHEVVLTAEPSGTAVTSRIRKWLKDETVPSHDLLLCFCADRAIHLHETILPALRRGAFVICDRYTLSTIAYQTSDNDPALVRSLCHLHPVPDLTVILDPPLEVAAARVKRRAMPPDRYERSVAMQLHAAVMYRDENNWLGPTILLNTEHGTIMEQHDQILKAIDERVPWCAK